MMAEQVRMSWGEPDKIRQTEAGSGKSEPWGYGDGNILDFKNGMLTGFKN